MLHERVPQGHPFFSFYYLEKQCYQLPYFWCA